MRRLLKLSLSLVAVLIIVAIALPFLIPMERYKQEIAAQVKQLTGRELVIAGDMRASVFPALGIDIENASLSNPAGYTDKTMLQVGKLSVEVELWPLFSKEIRVKRFVLEKPVINLEISASGKPNWEFQVQSGTPSAAAAQPQAKKGNFLAGLMLGDVRVSNGEIRYRDRQKNRTLQLDDVALKATADAARIDISDIRATLYGGAITANTALNADGSFTKRVSVKGVQAEPFLTNAMGEKRFSGALDMEMDIRGTLIDFKPLMGSLDGKGNVHIRDGAMKGVDIAGMIRNVQSAFKEVDTAQKKTDFSELSGTFTIDKGILNNNDLMMKAPLFRLAGQGAIDLPQQRIKYRLTPEIVETAQGQGGKEKQGLAVPVIIEGPLDNPRYAPDISGLAQELLQNPDVVKDTVKSVKEQFKENKGAIKDLLQGIGR